MAQIHDIVGYGRRAVMWGYLTAYDRLGGGLLAREVAQRANPDGVVNNEALVARSVRERFPRAAVVLTSTAGELCATLDVPGSTLSFHLKELTHAGLVNQERASRFIIYRAAYEQMNALLGYLGENCCQGNACAVDQSQPARATSLCGC